MQPVRHRMLLLPIAAALALLLCAASDAWSAQPGPLAIRDWNELADRLWTQANAVPKTRHRDDEFGIESTAVYAQLRDTDSPLLWTALLRQRERPGLHLLGFRLFLNQRPSLARRAALMGLAHWKRHPLLLYESLLSHLSDGDWSEQDMAHLHAYFSRAVPREDAFVIAAVPAPVRKAWVTRALERGLVDPNIVACTLDELASEPGGAEAWASQLRQLRPIPGLPRRVYLRHVLVIDAADVRLARQTLLTGDTDAVDFLLVLERFADHLDLGALKPRLSEEKRTIVADFENRRGAQR